MSFFEDYIQDGLVCPQCGELIDEDEPGYMRICAVCQEENEDGCDECD